MFRNAIVCCKKCHERENAENPYGSRQYLNPNPVDFAMKVTVFQISNVVAMHNGGVSTVYAVVMVIWEQDIKMCRFRIGDRYHRYIHP